MKRLVIVVIAVVLVSCLIEFVRNVNTNKVENETTVSIVENTIDSKDVASTKTMDKTKGIQGDLVGSQIEVTSDYHNASSNYEIWIFKNDFMMRMMEDPVLLAEYMLESGMLDEFVEAIDSEGRAENPRNIAEVLKIFCEDEELHIQALIATADLLAESSVDSNWKEPRSDDFETFEEYNGYLTNGPQVLPLATIAETGEPISSRPGEPWDGPMD